mmetsp:Transcript_28180/g.70383  ORF Transcript_28180/g.70383 Transcript_28180/m.70383 type:complete len:88 (+) Transcript_28180:1045-1308(+)
MENEMALLDTTPTNAQHRHSHSHGQRERFLWNERMSVWMRCACGRDVRLSVWVGDFFVRKQRPFMNGYASVGSQSDLSAFLHDLDTR